MRIVFVDWLIKKGQEPDFKDYWKSKLPIADRSKMIGEFLSQPAGHEKFPWVTWDCVTTKPRASSTSVFGPMPKRFTTRSANTLILPAVCCHSSSSCACAR